jgi:sterol desaturase/sphingolipid hydroxylase (fatty acid hydroxylase superfamily)
MFFGTYLGLMAVEAVRPGRAFVRMRLWRLQGLAYFVMSFSLAFVLPYVWDAWLAEHRILDASGLGVGLGALVGVLVMELVTWCWHRLLHKSDLLFRWFHQTHHAAERIDMFSAWTFHPLDVAGFSLVGSFSLVFLVGLRAEAAVLAVTIVNCMAMFTHANVKTPRWLGYIIERPESHAVHHERGVHAYNYCELPLWDMLFGTFNNPATFEREVGFWDGASRRFGALLFGRDVSQPPPSDEVTQEEKRPLRLAA